MNAQNVNAMVREFASGKTNDEWIQLSHLVRNTILPFLPKGGIGLEIGTWKGESAVWFLENGLARMDVIDPFTGGAEHSSSHAELKIGFLNNTKGFRASINLHEGRSVDVLPRIALAGNRYDFIYIDGSHDSRDVIVDATIGWMILKSGGIMAFDDYQWEYNKDAFRNPKPAIDFFMSAYAPDLKVLTVGLNVVVRKL